MTDIAQSPCASCSDHCCCVLALTVSDVARIVRHLQIPLDEFVTLYINEFPEMQSYVFQIQGKPRSIGLKAPQDDPAGCPFLLKFETRERCGIHDFRPGVCRIFPFERRDGVIAPNPKTFCAPRFGVAPDDPGFQRAFDDYERELEIHAGFCREWNQTPARYPSSLAKLLEFVEAILESGAV